MPPSSLKRPASSDDGALALSSTSNANATAAAQNKRIKTEAKAASTHVYLCIDRSGSMKNPDVSVAAPPGGAGADDVKDTADGGSSTSQFMTRYDAVFAAASHLVQLQKGTGDAIDFSLILWNDEAEWIFRNQGAEETLDLLAEAKLNNPPRLGTNFSNCFKMLREYIAGDGSTGGSSGNTGKMKAKADPGVGGSSPSSTSSSVIIFLSDGRPGDLRAIPPAQNESIQPTYRRNQQEYESVGGHLNALGPHLPPGTLHFVGIHESGYPWLRWLAEKYNGTFHQSMLHFGQVAVGGDDDDETGTDGNIAAEAGAGVPAEAAEAAPDASNGGDENEPEQAAIAVAGANQEDEKGAIMGEQNLGGDDENGNSNGKDQDDGEGEENTEKGEGEEEFDFDPNEPNATSDNSDDDDDGDDDDLEFVEEVSASERIRRNIAQGEVISIASQSQSQSIMDTFSSLSQSISQVHESQLQSQGDDSYDDDNEDPYADDL